jgi:L-lactate dehydrogenase complex protein LldF
VCPVRIDLPALLVNERRKAVEGHHGLEAAGFALLGRAFRSRRAYERAQRFARLVQRPLARGGWVRRFPPGPLRAWGRSRDLPAVPGQTFREWWRSRERT